MLFTIAQVPVCLAIGAAMLTDLAVPEFVGFDVITPASLRPTFFIAHCS